MRQNNIHFFAMNKPYEMYYKIDVAAYPVGAHTHNVAELYLTLTELPEVLLNDTVSRVKSGSLIIIPPFCVHQLYHEQGVEYERYILNLNIEWLNSVLSDHSINIDYLKYADKPAIISLDARQQAALTDKMNQFLSVQAKNDLDTLAHFFAVFGLIDSLVRSVQKNNTFEQPIMTEAQKKVNEIIAYINENLMNGITVEQIAEHFYLNKDYLSRLFSRCTHTTIGRYVAFQRISKAQELLREGKTVTQVQEMMVYSSYAHFFKAFQKMTGISPSKYRKP
ncbi:MAG: helix-turn-helix transcriptional regulator [Lachnospiraceae bacterium]|nr:helix-turn-helix transcriptional regulator [Lachnospiraceae bacterium]